MLIINDQLETHHKLSQGIIHWLKNELKQLSSQQQRHNQNEQQTNECLIEELLWEKGNLGKFLRRVNYQYFSKTQILDYNSVESRKRVFMILEKYINYTQKKRFSKKYRNILLPSCVISNSEYVLIQYDNQTQKDPKVNNYIQSNNLIQTNILIHLLLFISTRSQNNQQFISRIITLSIQQQHQLKEEIQSVADQLLEEITQRQQLAIRFNQLKQDSVILTKKANQIGSYNSSLRNRLERSQKGRIIIQSKLKQNYLQKLTLCQHLTQANPTTPFTTIFRQYNDRNTLLHLLLQQKQKKHQQLMTKNKQIVEQLDSFQQVLEELVKEKKQVKRIMNEKENQSFMLEMRVSLRGSESNGWGYGSKRSSNFCDRDLLRTTNCNDNNNDDIIKSQKRRSSLHTSTNPLNTNSMSQMNQSINIISKIQQLRNQKQTLMKQLTQLKQENNKLKKKQIRQQKVFKQLDGVYNEFLRECGVGCGQGIFNIMSKINIGNSNRLLKKQRSKTLLTKVNSRRYIQ